MSQKKFKVNIYRVLALLLAATLLFASAPAVTAAGGSCGSSLEWSFDGSTLSITGSGAMADYSGGSAPWYQYRDSILKVSLPSGLTHIGKAAFYDCVKLGSVSLPTSVESIGEAAFYRCSGMSMLSLNSGLRSIGRKAFQECSSLADLRLPGTLVEIGNYAFYMCSGLSYVTVPSSVTSMGSGVFAYCDNLIRVDVEAAVNMSDWSFYGCDNLQTVTVQGTAVNPGSMQVSTNAAGVILDVPQAGVGTNPGSTTTTPAGQPSNNLGMGTGTTTGSIVVPPSGQPSNTTGTGIGTTTPGSVVTPPIDQPVPAPETGNATAGKLTVDSNGDTVLDVTTVQKTENSTTVSSQQTPVETPGKIQTTISSTIQNNEGWQDVVGEVNSSLSTLLHEKINVTVFTPNSESVEKEVLQEFTGKNVTLTVQTQSGNQFTIDCTKLPETIKKDLDLSYTLTPAENIPEEMSGCIVYQLKFNESSEIVTEMIIHLPGDHSYHTASLYRMERKKPIQIQSVLVDSSSNAHWYLRNINHRQDYLIGIDIPGAVVDSPIIPAELAGVYKVANVYDGVEYVVTGRSSSWNMGLGRVMAILAAVMVSAIVMVGFVMYLYNKRRLQSGYVPQWEDDDE